MQERINKASAAQQHLETAISLHFDIRSPIAVHTLAASAFWVLEDLCKSHQVRSYWDETDVIINPELRPLLKKAIRKHYDFFRHADRAPSEIIEFDPEYNDFMIFIAIENFSRLGHRLPPSFLAYRSWFSVVQPGTFDIEDAWAKAAAEVYTTMMQRLPRTDQLLFGQIFCCLFAEDPQGAAAAFEPIWARHSSWMPELTKLISKVNPARR